MPDYVKCPKCNKSIREGIPFCPHCGERQIDNRAKDEFGKDPYYILQLSHHAESEVIDAAYKRLAMKYHPDKDSSPEAQEKMKELNWAFDILGNPDKKREFDRREKAERKTHKDYQTKTERKQEYKPPPTGKTEKKKEPKSPHCTPIQEKKKVRGWVIVLIGLGIILVLLFMLMFDSSDSISSIVNSVSVAISDNTKSPTKKATMIPTNTPRLELDYFTLNITNFNSGVLPIRPIEKFLAQLRDNSPDYNGGKDEVVETYKAIRFQNVSRHIGERLAVCGPVTSIYQNQFPEDRTTFIEFGTKFAAIISESSLSDFEDILEYLNGEAICVYGFIYKENNEIYLSLNDTQHIFGDFWEEVRLNLDYPPRYFWTQEDWLNYQQELDEKADNK